jgi:transposase
MIDAARTVKHHRDGILRWFDSRIANGLIEGINSLVQAAKAKARGYRSARNLKAIVYLLGQQTRTEPASLTTFQPIPNSEEPVFE